MKRTNLRVLFVLALVLLATSVPVACNVFVSLDRCESDRDCPSGQSCDPEGRFCLATTPPAEASTDVADAGDADVEADVDATLPPCDLTKPFLPPTLVLGLENRAISSARFTSTEKTIYFSALNGGIEESNADLFSAARPDRSSPFLSPNPIPIVNSSTASEYWPTITADGKLMFFDSGRSLTKVDGGYVQDISRIWSATKPSTIADFDEPHIQSVFEVPDAAIGETSPYIHPGGRALYFASFERGGKGFSDIFVAKLSELGTVISVTNVDAVNTPFGELHPVVSLDDKVLLFGRETLPTSKRDIFVSTRKSPDDAFGPAIAVSELNTDYEDFPSWVSDDLCRLYFISDRPTPGASDAGDAGSVVERFRLWIASRPPAR